MTTPAIEIEEDEEEVDEDWPHLDSCECWLCEAAAMEDLWG